MLEHFKNVEKGIDQIYRNNTGKEELPDGAYSYMPKAIEDMMNGPAAPAYPQQYGQPGVPMQSGMPMQPGAPVPPAAPVQPTPVVQGNWNCPNCGVVNSGNSQFCISCGHKKV